LIATLDPHNEEMLKRFLKNTPYSLMSSRFLVSKTIPFLKTIGCDPSQAIVVSPDRGAVQRALNFNKNIRTDETPIVVFDKKRDPVTGAVVSIEPLENGYLVKDAVVIVRDDIISGGGTFVAIAKELKKLGAKKIILALSFNEGICKKEILQSAGVDAIISQVNIKEPENNDKYFI
jgi:ribose-phosphate pyrophosphokinase